MDTEQKAEAKRLAAGILAAAQSTGTPPGQLVRLFAEYLTSEGRGDAFLEWVTRETEAIRAETEARKRKVLGMVADRLFELLGSQPGVHVVTLGEPLPSQCDDPECDGCRLVKDLTGAPTPDAKKGMVN